MWGLLPLVAVLGTVAVKTANAAMEALSRPDGKPSPSSSQKSPRSYHFFDKIDMMTDSINSLLKRLAALADGSGDPSDAPGLLDACRRTLGAADDLFKRTPAMDLIGVLPLHRLLELGALALADDVKYNTRVNSHSGLPPWANVYLSSRSPFIRPPTFSFSNVQLWAEAYFPTPPAVPAEDTTADENATTSAENVISNNEYSGEISAPSPAKSASPEPAPAAAASPSATPSPGPKAQTDSQESPRTETPCPESPLPPREPAPTPAVRPSPPTTTSGSSPATLLSGCTTRDDDSPTSASAPSSPCSRKEQLPSAPVAPVRPASPAAPAEPVSPAVCSPTRTGVLPCTIETSASAPIPSRHVPAQTRPAASIAAAPTSQPSSAASTPKKSAALSPKIDNTVESFEPKDIIIDLDAPISKNAPWFVASPSPYPTAIDWAVEEWNASVALTDVHDVGLLMSVRAARATFAEAYTALIAAAAAGGALPLAAVLSFIAAARNALSVSRDLRDRLHDREIFDAVNYCDVARRVIFGGFLRELISSTIYVAYYPIDAAGTMLPREIPEVQDLLEAIEGWADEACPPNSVAVIHGFGWLSRGLDGPVTANIIHNLRRGGAVDSDPFGRGYFLVLPQRDSGVAPQEGSVVFVPEVKLTAVNERLADARAPLQALENVGGEENGGRKGVVASGEAAAAAVGSDGGQDGARPAAGHGTGGLDRP